MRELYTRKHGTRGHTLNGVNSTGWTYVRCIDCGRRVRSRLSGETTTCTACGGRPYVPVGAVRARVWLACRGPRGCGHQWSSTAADGASGIRCPSCGKSTRVPVNARRDQAEADEVVAQLDRERQQASRIRAPRAETAPRPARVDRRRRLHGLPVNPQPAPGPMVQCVLPRRAGPASDDWTWCESPALGVYQPADARVRPRLDLAPLGAPGFPVCEGCLPVLARARIDEPLPGTAAPRDGGTTATGRSRPPALPDLQPAPPWAVLSRMATTALARRMARTRRDD